MTAEVHSCQAHAPAEEGGLGWVVGGTCMKACIVPQSQELQASGAIWSKVVYQTSLPGLQHKVHPAWPCVSTLLDLAWMLGRATLTPL